MVVRAIVAQQALAQRRSGAILVEVLSQQFAARKVVGIF